MVSNIGHLLSHFWILQESSPNVRVETLCKKIPVFTEDHSAVATQFFNEQEEGNYFYDEHDHRWEIKKYHSKKPNSLPSYL